MRLSFPYLCYMRRMNLVVAALCICTCLRAEIVPDRNEIDFGVVLAHTLDSEKIILRNTGSLPAEIVSIKLYAPEFHVKDSIFTISGGDSHSLYVYFMPKHNIVHTTGLIVLGKAEAGNAVVNLSGQGRYADMYYISTENLSEEALKNALKKLISGHRSLGYTKARDTMYAIIDNEGGIVECVYTGRKATFSTRAGAVDNNFNTEHTYPQSFFAEAEPMRSDLFHLYPTDETANSIRSNHPFGVVASASWSNGGSKSNGSRFEPRDVHKGDAARALFYFVIRYQDYSNFVRQQESILRQWAVTDMPDTTEEARNDAIYIYQKNRNPFIDHPEFLERIQSICSTSVAPVVISYDVPVYEVFLENVQKPGSVIYLLPVVNQGTLPLYITQATFDFQNSFSLLDVTDTIAPGKAGWIQFQYRSSATEMYGPMLYFKTLQGSEVSHDSILIHVGSQHSSIPEQQISPVTLYPNPAGTWITIDGISGEGTYSLMVVDAHGRLMMLENNVLDNTRLSVSALPQGIYWLVLRNEEGEVVKQFIRE
ncbi:MAG: endonuclease [Bacteroidota bacterium]|nr:endonuclease [Bacteroidota bacterium]